MGHRWEGRKRCSIMGEVLVNKKETIVVDFFQRYICISTL